MHQFRETIWGIHPKDRRWFQLITLTGGIAGSVLLTMLELDSLSNSPITPSQAARNIVVGIGASFAAAGFIAWGVIQVKEMPMAIADWIRDATEKRREKLRQEGYTRGEAQGFNRGVAQGYDLGYDDSQSGNPRRPPENPPYDPPQPENGKPGGSE